MEEAIDLIVLYSTMCGVYYVDILKHRNKFEYTTVFPIILKKKWNLLSCTTSIKSIPEIQDSLQ